ncbi:MAG: serine hydrolase [Rhodospirillales bacterium]|nr:serine hydrolase [Rhodospirillales bacterium]
MHRLLAALFLLVAGAAAAQVPADPAPVPPMIQAATPVPTEPHVLSEADLASWLDGMMPWALARGDLAGAVVTVVKDGQVLFARGYGYADVAKRVPIDPAKTLFRVASVSKLFTWTAIMQLVEQGKLDLDRDVNTYLDFKIPDAFGTPITLRHIMTHSAGFEEQLKDYRPTDARLRQPLGTWLRTHIPARVYKPGEVIAYSNYATGVAGYILERTYGKPFEQVMEDQILKPLGMANATFRQPVPDSLTPDLALGYRLASAPPSGFEPSGILPPGALSVSARDMAKFMIAHLNKGAPLLQPATSARMLEPTKAPVAGLNAMALGFYHMDRNGRRIVGHGGDITAFHSNVALLPDENVGLFISINSAGGMGVTGPLRTALLRSFLDRYFPAPALPDEPTLPTAAEHGQILASQNWISSRAGVASWLRLSTAQAPSTVTVHGDNTISWTAMVGPGGAPKRWREVQPFVWREVNGASRLVAQRDASGRPTMLGTDDIAPVMVWLPASVATGPTAMKLIWSACAVLGCTVLLWPVAALVRRYHDAKPSFEGRDRWLYRASRIVPAFLLVFFFGWFRMMTEIGTNLPKFSADLDPTLWLLQVIGVIGALGTLLLLWRAVQAWRDARFDWWGRISNSVIALAALVIVWAGVVYNLFDFGLNY